MGWFRKSKKHKAATEHEDLWVVCRRCKAHVFKEEWERNLKVCPKCNFHGRITFQERLDLVIDAGTFEEFDADITAADPLGFVDGKGSYADKARATERATGLKEAVITGRGQINGRPVVTAVMDFRFLGGSLAGGTGEKILLASDYALRHRRPYIVFSASGGARMHEGMVSLMQMAKTCAGIARLHQARVPYISVLTDPTFGGVSASFAMVGDLNIAEPGALIGFAGRRVIEQTIKQKLPEDFQTAEYLIEHGFIDCLVNRSEMKDFLHRTLKYWNIK
ncbi:MAG: acetyl-CoA carboxylase, carboxyltransferase subunit beta [Alphaproteobacteria bacterium]